MKLEDLALFGASPAFRSPLRATAPTMPEWRKVEATFRAIFARGYFANHGPAVTAFEREFADFLEIDHVVAVTNETIALMVLARALDRPGETLVPAFAPPATGQALAWASMKPRVCDVSPGSGCLTTDLAARAADRTVAILGFHAWGRQCDPDGRLQDLSDRLGVPLIFDASDALGCKDRGRSLAQFGLAAIFSFHETGQLNGGEGGCIVTRDGALAAQLRTLRNFHGQETPGREVSARLNGKMSEAQAALASIGLQDMTGAIGANQTRHAAWQSGLSGIPGLSLETPGAGETRNHHHAALVVDETVLGLPTRLLKHLLAAENVQCADRASWVADGDFPGARTHAGSRLMLPNGQGIGMNEVSRISDILRLAASHAGEIMARLDA